MSRIFKLFLVLTFVLPFTVFDGARADEIVAESAIRAATVYTSRAKVTRQAKVDVPAGAHTVVFKGLPAILLPDSLRVSGTAQADVQFGAVAHRQVMSAELTAPREQELNEKLEALQDQRRAVEQEKQALAAKKTFLENLGKQASLRANEDIAEIDLKPDQWAGAAQTIHTGISEILAADLQMDLRLRNIDREIMKVQRELNELRTGQRSTYEVAVPLESSAATKLTIELSYQVPSATWRPVYDARLDTQGEKLALVQYGAIRQNTGEDWTNIALTLSTAQPQRGASLPDLQPHWLDLWDPRQVQVMGGVAYNAAPAAPEAYRAKKSMMSREADMAMPMDAMEEQRKEATFAQAEIDTGGFVSEYKIPGPATVKSDGTETKLMVGGFDTDNKLQIHVRPQLSTEAFVVARAKLKGEAPVLPGQVSLFRDDAYIGQSNMPLLRPGEEYSLFFGVDDQVSVKRHVLKDEKGEAGIVGRSNVLERHFVTELQNLHSQPVEIVLQETVPVPRNDKITVDILKEATTAGYKTDTDNIKGMLSWTLRAEPKAKQNVKLGWRVSWPKDMSLSGL